METIINILLLAAMYIAGILLVGVGFLFFVHMIARAVTSAVISVIRKYKTLDAQKAELASKKLTKGTNK